VAFHFEFFERCDFNSLAASRYRQLAERLSTELGPNVWEIGFQRHCALEALESFRLMESVVVMGIRNRRGRPDPDTRFWEESTRNVDLSMASEIGVLAFCVRVAVKRWPDY
jgi:hypothetical protein